jgi:hypothetical protein
MSRPDSAQIATLIEGYDDDFIEGREEDGLSDLHADIEVRIDMRDYYHCS